MKKQSPTPVKVLRLSTPAANVTTATNTGVILPRISTQQGVSNPVPPDSPKPPGPGEQPPNKSTEKKLNPVENLLKIAGSSSSLDLTIQQNVSSPAPSDPPSSEDNKVKSTKKKLNEVRNLSLDIEPSMAILASLPPWTSPVLR